MKKVSDSDLPCHATHMFTPTPSSPDRQLNVVHESVPHLHTKSASIILPSSSSLWMRARAIVVLLIGVVHGQFVVNELCEKRFSSRARGEIRYCNL
jgi:hypothetical protein